MELQVCLWETLGHCPAESWGWTACQEDCEGASGPAAKEQGSGPAETSEGGAWGTRRPVHMPLATSGQPQRALWSSPLEEAALDTPSKSGAISLHGEPRSRAGGRGGSLETARPPAGSHSPASPARHSSRHRGWTRTSWRCRSGPTPLYRQENRGSADWVHSPPQPWGGPCRQGHVDQGVLHKAARQVGWGGGSWG